MLSTCSRHVYVYMCVYVIDMICMYLHDIYYSGHVYVYRHMEYSVYSYMAEIDICVSIPAILIRFAR
jgi:hypothetical protein